MGGAFEAPWAGRIWGTPSQGGERITAEWRGHAITLPTTGSDAGAEARGGLMLARASDSVETSAMPDGGTHRWSSTREILACIGQRRRM